MTKIIKTVIVLAFFIGIGIYFQYSHYGWRGVVAWIVGMSLGFLVSVLLILWIEN